MRSRSRLQLLIFFLLAFLAIRTTCHPRPVVSLRATASDPSLEADYDLNVGSVPEFKSGESAASTSLRRRSLGFQEFIEIGHGWNMYYSTWPSILLPVQPAAWALAKLYASMLTQARGKWAMYPPQHSISLSYGGISILMHCPQRPIPWLFVGNFAEKLLQITDGGWTGVYQVMLSQAETDVSIGVHLSVRS